MESCFICCRILSFTDFQSVGDCVLYSKAIAFLLERSIPEHEFVIVQANKSPAVRLSLRVKFE